MYFRNHELSKVFPHGIKPTPFPRNTSAGSMLPTLSVNTLNQNCHEITNDGSNYYDSIASLKMDTTDVTGFFEDDDTEEAGNIYSTDPHQRLIL